MPGWCAKDGLSITADIRKALTGPSKIGPNGRRLVSGEARSKCLGSGGAIAVVDETDIYRSANLLIKQHGADAAIYAAMQADECLAEGDLDGKVVWLAVIKAIEELRDLKPHGDGAARH